MILAIPPEETDLYRTLFFRVRKYLTDGEIQSIEALLRKTLVTGNADSDEWDRLKQTIRNAQERRAYELYGRKRSYRKASESSGKKKKVFRNLKPEQVMLLRRLADKRQVRMRKKGV